ncbi:L,D-transpeptidase family protein [Nocardioides sp. CPCC 206347]|uniref:L,D-transpeptidase family protein n=1 Tax=Nocardioides sp. CPCC 206347 TaxID=3406463 RepID=UPI003B43AEB1
MKTKTRVARRISLITLVAALCSVLAYGVGWAVQKDTLPWESGPQAAGASLGEDDQMPGEMPGNGAGNDDPVDDATDVPADPTEDPTDDPTDATDDPTPSTDPQPTKDPGPPPAGPALLSPGDRGPDVRDLQARLKQIDWFSGDVTDNYGDLTTKAVRGFQAKRGFEVTGEVDKRTLDRLHAMTRVPTRAELTNQPPPGNGGNKPGALDPRCKTGRVMCVDKSSRTLRWVVNGQVRKTVDVRFGSAELPTREGAFHVTRKSPNHVSSLYHTPMPFAMFFSDGQAVHYSPDFAANGYNGASHGCVNVRDRDAVAWLFDQVAVGDKVIVYWS